MRIAVLFLAGSLASLFLAGSVKLVKEHVVFVQPGDAYRDELNRRWCAVGAEHDRMLEAGVSLEDRDAFLAREGERIKAWRHAQGHRYPGE